MSEKKASFDLPQWSLTVYIENNYETEMPQDYRLDREVLTAIPWKNWFETWLTELTEDLPSAEAYEVSLRLTSDREIQLLNSQYRQQDKPTDVLAFAILEDPFPQEIVRDEPLYLGDIVISLDTACQQARSQQKKPILELAFLASHGLLHLLGWDHPDLESEQRMLARQENLMQLIGLSEVYLTC
jgi:probable rRNA maturation factor